MKIRTELGILSKIFKKKTNSNELTSLDFTNSDSILKIVVELYNEIWTDSKKWKENHQKIERYLTELLSLNPNDTRALTNLGAILSDNGKHKNALTELLKAEKLESKDANLYRNIGIAKMNIESERQNAKEYFEIANKFKSDELTIEAYFDPHGH
ncbi:tetratricopeptide repeat protein [Mariniflexile jejuense]|uniref:Tetratricopeptide repeat protein n=1 Tax=Mariniflexile jejuense TaxID=1173582 RepID=A0ABW3JND1_9FLAO